MPPQQQQYQAPQASGPPVGPDIGGNIMAGIQNLLYQPFSPQGIGNAITGFATGQRTDPVGAYQQMAQATYQALRSAGYPDADARLAATNPDMLKTLVTNAYQQPKFEKAGAAENAYLVGGGAGRLGPGAPGISGVGGAGVTQLQQGLSRATQDGGKVGAEERQDLSRHPRQGSIRHQRTANIRTLTPTQAHWHLLDLARPHIKRCVRCWRARSASTTRLLLLAMNSRCSKAS